MLSAFSQYFNFNFRTFSRKLWRRKNFKYCDILILKNNMRWLLRLCKFRILMPFYKRLAYHHYHFNLSILFKCFYLWMITKITSSILFWYVIIRVLPSLRSTYKGAVNKQWKSHFHHRSHGRIENQLNFYFLKIFDVMVNGLFQISIFFL